MEEQLAQGSRLGRYRLLTPLGHGGMASVWVALERIPGGQPRFVAIKVMLPRLARLSAFRAMFLDEGQLVRSIDHPGVVRVFEVGEDRGVLFMAMEWVEGDSLHTLIKEARKRRAVPPEMAVRMIADVAGGLHEAHELRGWDGELRGVVHCDVSPHNILIGLDGHAKLTDFGVAHAAAMSVAEREGAMMGKVGYMSPEQAFGSAIDRRSDIFSLGVVLFELTTGKRLFGRKELRETLELVQHAVVPPPTTVWPDYPPLLEPIVMRALAREPGRRYKTAEEFRRVLEQYLIETRTLVSAAGVGRLLTRVLGAKIAERREEVRAALSTLHEAAPKNAMLVAIPTHEAGEDAERSDAREDWHVTVAGSSVVAGRRSPPGAVTDSQSLAADTAPLPAGGDYAEVEGGRPLRHLWPWAVAVTAVAAAGGAAVLASRAGGATPEVPVSATAVEPRERTAPSAAPEAAADPGDTDAVSIERIPVVKEPEPGAASPPRLAPPRVAVPAPTPTASARGTLVPAPGPAASLGAPPPTARAPALADEDMGFLEEGKKPKAPVGADLDIENPYR